MANGLYKNVEGAGGSVPVRYRVIKNSEVIKVNDWITDESTGAANVDGVTEPILGLAVDIVTSNKISLRSSGVNTADYDGTWSASTSEYTAAADNETDKQVLVAYVPVREGRQFVAVIDAAKGTTTGSNKEGYYLAVLTSDSSKLDESTAATSSSNTQFRIVDPFLAGPTTEVIVEAIVRGEE